MLPRLGTQHKNLPGLHRPQLGAAKWASRLRHRSRCRVATFRYWSRNIAVWKTLGPDARFSEKGPKATIPWAVLAFVRVVTGVGARFIEPSTTGWYDPDSAHRVWGWSLRRHPLERSTLPSLAPSPTLSPAPTPAPTSTTLSATLSPAPPLLPTPSPPSTPPPPPTPGGLA